MTRVTGAWLVSDGAQRVFGFLEKAGYQAFAVGGCVRNALLSEPISDIDIATNARPDMVLKHAKLAGLQAIPTGIDHGTVTVISEGIPYEITTFRADIETDGRHATVLFSDDISQDAARRDLTMNALYCDKTGRVVDPLNGLPDLQARRVRFIADPQDRIREDYLRSLRFFRFFAWYGDPEAGMDSDAIAAIAANLEGLETLSRERVGSEIKKLLSAADPLMAISVAAQIGVLGQVMPGTSVVALGPLLEHEIALDLPPEPMRRLAALGDVDPVSLRLSNVDKRRLYCLRQAVQSAQTISALAYYEGAEVARSAAALRCAVFEQPLDPVVNQQAEHASRQKFPISARDLMPDFQGKALGDALHKLEALWIESGFALSKDALLRTLKG